MDITPSQGASAAQTASQSAGRSNAALSSDFETFLRMMTAQIENQDPLNPLQSSDFAVQLATFSGVEQQVKTNDLLTALILNSDGGIGQYADWIGREALSFAPAFFDGQPIEVQSNPVAGAESAELIVSDQSGRVVDRMEMPVESGSVTWDGMAETEQPFLTGLYSFTVESKIGDDVIARIPGSVYATVREARFDDTGAMVLVMEGGALVAPQQIIALRQPEPG